MATLRPFKGLRPVKELAEKVASFPYDVIDSKEARELAKGNPYSFLHVGKSEIDLPVDTDLYGPKVYAKAKENLQKFIQDKVLVQDSAPYLYIYRQTMEGREQYGIVATASVNEYNKNIIKRHELTRKDKEDDRTNHTLGIMANAGPVFLTYRDSQTVNRIVADFVKNNSPEYDFIKEDKIAHTLWVVKDSSLIQSLVAEFKKIPALYIADGHHRNASAARAQKILKEKDTNPSPDKEYNYYLACFFPASHLKIFDYNRLAINLNGHDEKTFLEKVQEKFEIIGTDTAADPKKPGEFGMYLGQKWYQLRAKSGTYPKHDPVAGLDVSVLQNNLLRPVLGIDDPRTSKNIDFVGGIRGAKELQRRVDNGDAKVAFKLYPPSIEQLLTVSDANLIMPPKSTWFEPKLRSGLVVHLLD
ncbi:MAG: DUF1015 family protein [Pseudomonadota bacterium]